MLCLFAISAQAEVALGVMSFNIRHGAAADGENAWPERREHAADVIRAHDPVVVGLQECLEFQRDYLVERLGNYRSLGIGRDRDGRGEECTVLYKADTVTPVAYSTFWLSETPEEPGSKSWDSAITRIVTQIKFFHQASGKFFYFFNTHFDHRGETARLKSAELLAARVAELPQDIPVIVVGDFNAYGATSPPWKALVTGGVEDAWLAAAERKGPASTWCGFQAPKPDAAQRIDWILFRGGIRASVCETVVSERDGRYPSDHFPVVATLHLPF